MTILKIKNMVCPRCIMAVTAILERHGFLPKQVVLDEAQVEAYRNAFQKIGYEVKVVKP